MLYIRAYEPFSPFPANRGSSRLIVGASLQQGGPNFNVRHMRGDNIKLGLRAKRAGSSCSRLNWKSKIFDNSWMHTAQCTTKDIKISLQPLLFDFLTFVWYSNLYSRQHVRRRWVTLGRDNIKLDESSGYSTLTCGSKKLNL